MCSITHDLVYIHTYIHTCTTGIVGAISYSAVNGLPSEMTVGAGLYTENMIGTCFVTGILAGIFSLGGDVTALPFIYQGYVCVCVCLCLCVYLCLCVCVYVCVCVFMSVCVFMYVCV